MIIEPVSIINASAVPQVFKRNSQNGSASDWVNTTTNTVSDKGTMKVAHQKFGKGGVSRRSLIGLTRAVTSTGVTESVTMNFTIAMPDQRTVLTDAQLDDIKAELVAFLSNGTLWGNIKLGES